VGIERVLVVEDDPLGREFLSEALRRLGREVHAVDGVAAGIGALRAAPPDLVITDLRLPDGSGLEMLRAAAPEGTPVVVLTAFGTVETAVAAMREGAEDFLTKPFPAEQVALLLQRIDARARLVRENAWLRDQRLPADAEVLGASPAFREALELAGKAASSDATVLLTGESGTGKERFAGLIHRRSARRAGPYICLNCAAIPESLLESELFGHERGAFTGADRRREGRFELAHGGTLLLDEIGELPLPLQVKLLQAIEEKTFTRVGGNRPVTVDVRLVAATNRDLEAMVRERQFREDLFFRLNVFPIAMPPLRERPGDVRGLVGYFLRRRGASPEQVTEPALQALESYPFPGNVRELEHTLERALILAGGDSIGPEHLSFARPELAGSLGGVPRIPPGGLSLEDLERDLILQALELAKGNKSQAARLLGLTRRTLYSRMEKHGLRKPGEGEEPEGDVETAEVRVREDG